MAFGSYSALKLLEDSPELVTAGVAILGTSAALLLGAVMVKRVIAARNRPLTGQRLQRRLDGLREQGVLTGDLTFEDAVELNRTGTVRPKGMADHVRRSVDTIRMIYGDDEHGALYQFEMGGVGIHHIEAAEQAAATLDQAATLAALQDTRAIFEQFEREMAEAEGDLDMATYDVLQDRSRAIGEAMRGTGAIDAYVSAARSYLSRHAPHLLPIH